jgi:hypothetical protein
VASILLFAIVPLFVLPLAVSTARLHHQLVERRSIKHGAIATGTARTEAVVQFFQRDYPPARHRRDPQLDRRQGSKRGKI